MVLPEDRAAHRAGARRLRDHGEADVELRVRRPDGEVRWIHVRGRIVDPGGCRLALGVSYDITRRKQAEMALRESETRLQLALAAGRMGVWDWQVGADAVHWSDGMFELLGLPRATVPSATRFMSMVLDEDRAAVQAAVAEALVAGDFAHEFRMRRGDGNVIWVAGRGAAVRDASGRALRLLGANFDITERKHAEAARDAASQRKDDFLAMLAHELRNPLAAIGAAADVLPRATEQPAVLAAGGIIGRQVRHLARMIDDLVDLARIQRGRVTLRREAIDVIAALHGAIEQAEPGIAARGQSLALSAPDAPVVVVADAIRLAQVFANLLANATQYSAPGARIDLRVVPCGQGVDVVVEDSGAGIDPAVLPHVFEPFTQGPRSLDRAQGGLGLGLALVKSLVEMHGGSVRAESAGPGCGARFTVRLPVREADVGGPGSEREGSPATSRARRILVVDDNADAAESLAMLLSLDGHEVRTALDGGAALATARDFLPEVALLDIGLPGMDGYELAAALRAEPALAGLRLVALTGYGQPEDRARSQAAGFDLHVVKPIGPEDLARCLDA
jgi:PAS domain S-box-containing protein